MKNLVLKAHHLKKAFYAPKKVEILKEVDLSIYQGDSIAIMGRSGQGKSTLLHILGTLENACGGDLEIAGQKVTAFNRAKIRNQHIAFVFQSFHLLEDYTALENVLMPARIGRKGVSPSSPSYKEGLKLLEQVGLQARAHFHTKLLSGGEKQRVAIARALCNRPDIIFADEPSGNLDKETSSHIHELLLNYVKQEGKTLVVVTHSEELAALCHQRYYLENGFIEKQ